MLWVSSEKTANALLLAPQGLNYVSSLAIALTGAFSCRQLAVEFVRKADAARTHTPAFFRRAKDREPIEPATEIRLRGRSGLVSCCGRWEVQR